jgi:hypothetical protein
MNENNSTVDRQFDDDSGADPTFKFKTTKTIVQAFKNIKNI